jgi:hypothetical protein
MLRRAIAGQSLGTDKWISSDPLDSEIIESLFKKTIREGEEKLLMAVLSDAIDHFQKYAFSKDEKGRKLFQEAEEWFLEKDNGALFSFEYISETLQLHPDYIRKGLLSWKDARDKARLVQKHRTDRKALARRRVKHPSIRLSKTA